MHNHHTTGRLKVGPVGWTETTWSWLRCTKSTLKQRKSIWNPWLQHLTVATDSSWSQIVPQQAQPTLETSKFSPLIQPITLHHSVFVFYLNICAICWHELFVDVRARLPHAALWWVHAAAAPNLHKNAMKRMIIYHWNDAGLTESAITEQPKNGPSWRASGCHLRRRWGSRCRHCGPRHKRASQRKVSGRSPRSPPRDLPPPPGCTLGPTESKQSPVSLPPAMHTPLHHVTSIKADRKTSVHHLTVNLEHTML